MARVYNVYGSGFAGGSFGKGRSNIWVKDEAIPVLMNLEKNTKSDLMRSARHTSYTLMLDLKGAIATGGAEGISIPKRKTLGSFGISQVMAKFKTRKLKTGNGAAAKRYMLRLTRRFQGDTIYANKSLQRAINYAPAAGGYVTGWGSKKSPYWGDAVQEARRGTPYAMTWKGGNQMYTDKQRRFFAAIGLPIPKKHMFMHQPKADFFGPFVRNRIGRGWFQKTMENRLSYLLKKRETEAVRKVA